jgi:hypothetical protein
MLRYLDWLHDHLASLHGVEEQHELIMDTHPVHIKETLWISSEGRSESELAETGAFPPRGIGEPSASKLAAGHSPIGIGHYSKNRKKWGARS